MSKAPEDVKIGEVSDFENAPDSPEKSVNGNAVQGASSPGNGPATEESRAASENSAAASADAATPDSADAPDDGVSASSPDAAAASDENLPAVEGEKNLNAAALSAPPSTESSSGEPEEEKNAPPTEKPMSLMEHLGELRSRLIRSAIAVGLAFMACYSVADDIFAELMKPLVKALPPESKLIFTALPEAFFVYMQVAFVAAVFLASPFIFYQVWAFIAPGLYEEERRHVVPLAAFSAFFFITGALFCYFSVFPFAFTFFMGFATDIIVPMPSLSEYLSFALKLMIAFGLIFEMPLFTFFLARMGLVSAEDMRRVRRYAILAIFIIAAILTPPDVLSQLLMAGPMLVLYELSIFIAVMFGKKKKEPAVEKTAEGQ